MSTTRDEKKDDPPDGGPTAISDKLSTVSNILTLIARPLVNFITIALPHIISFTTIAYQWYSKLPIEQTKILIGTIFCFFGGVYPALFAAIEAAKHGGWEDLKAAVIDLAQEALVIVEQSKKDDDLDEDGDGVKDVNQIGNKEYIMRKINLVIVKINPAKVDKALGTIYKVWLSVVAVLTVKFAGTIALAISISEFIKKPLNRFIAPIIQAATPDEYDKWVPILFGWFTKAIAISIAWYIQAVISAVTSSLIGALMITRAVLTISRRKYDAIGKVIPEDLSETQIDEMFSYVLAALGVYIQFKMNFDVPFPLNIPLFPFEFAEYYIRWSVTVVTPSA